MVCLVLEVKPWSYSLILTCVGNKFIFQGLLLRFKVGLVLDGWLYPLKDEVMDPPQPIVFINTGNSKYIFFWLLPILSMGAEHLYN